MSSSKSARSANGYILVYDPTHENAMKSENWSGYVYLHIKVAAKKYGRSISDDEDVHHIDTNRSNNDPSNLAILKKSVHAQIHNAMKLYGFVNSLTEQLALLTVDRTKYCKCGSKIYNRRAKICKTCAISESAKLFVSKEELGQLVKDKSFVAIGKMFGVSDNAIRKRCIKFGIDFKKQKRNTKTL